MPQDTPITCDGCGKRFLIEHFLSCPKDGLVMAQHDDAAKKWGALGSRAIIHSAISYEPKISSRKVQGERTGARARKEGGTAKGDVIIVVES